MCTPSDKNLAIFLQNVIPTITPVIEKNQIFFATTSIMPSYIQFNRIWNFLCNGIFEGNHAVVTFDGTELIRECGFDIAFEGDIYGQLTFKKKDFQLQDYIRKEILSRDGVVYAVRFHITKPDCFKIGRPLSFYFNIILYDGH